MRQDSGQILFSCNLQIRAGCRRAKQSEPRLGGERSNRRVSSFSPFSAAMNHCLLANQASLSCQLLSLKVIHQVHSNQMNFVRIV